MPDRPSNASTVCVLEFSYPDAAPLHHPIVVAQVTPGERAGVTEVEGNLRPRTLSGYWIVPVWNGCVPGHVLRAFDAARSADFNPVRVVG